MSKPLIFISFTGADEEIAIKFRETIADGFLGQFDTFMSAEDIMIGDQWRDNVHKKLKACSLLIAIVTSRSSHRAWINYEIGAVSIQDKKVIAVVGPNYDHDKLPSTYDTRQALLVGNTKDFEKLLKALVEYLPGTRKPKIDFAPFIEFFTDFEQRASKRKDLIEILDKSSQVLEKLPIWLNQASKSAILCGIHFQKSLSDHRTFYHEAAERGVCFTFAVLDPESDDVDRSARSFNMESEELKQECISGLIMIKNLKVEVGKILNNPNHNQIECVILKERANARYYIFDEDQADGLVAYTPYMDMRSSLTPTYVYGSSNPAAKQYIEACKLFLARNK